MAMVILKVDTMIEDIELEVPKDVEVYYDPLSSYLRIRAERKPRRGRPVKPDYKKEVRDGKVRGSIKVWVETK